MVDIGVFDPHIIIKPNKKVVLTGSVTRVNGDKRFDILADTTWSDTEVGESGDRSFYSNLYQNIKAALITAFMFDLYNRLPDGRCCFICR